MESMILQLHEREKDNRRLMEDVRQVRSSVYSSFVFFLTDLYHEIFIYIHTCSNLMSISYIYMKLFFFSIVGILFFFFIIFFFSVKD